MSINMTNRVDVVGDHTQRRGEDEKSHPVLGEH